MSTTVSSMLDFFNNYIELDILYLFLESRNRSQNIGFTGARDSYLARIMQYGVFQNYVRVFL